MDFLVLGPVEIRNGSRRVDLGGRRQRSVLARLLVAAGTVVSTDRLIDDVWQGRRSDATVSGLHAYISNLRRALEPTRPPRAPATVLVTQEPGYVLHVPAGHFDVTRFEAAAAEGMRKLSQHDPTGAVQAFDTALEQWRGPAYADLADEHWLGPEAARLDDLRTTAREQWAEAQLTLGNAPSVVSTLKGLVEDYPIRETLWRCLALALHYCGRAAEALAVLRRLRKHLAEALGVHPGRAVRELEQALVSQHTTLGSGSTSLSVERRRMAPSGPARTAAPQNARPPALPVLATPSWVDMSRDQARAMWNELTEWLRTLLLARYPRRAVVITSCWYRHPEAVEQLTWLHACWRATYRNPQALPRDAAEWHLRYLPAAISQLAQILAACRSGGHRSAAVPDVLTDDNTSLASFIAADLASRR